MKELLMAVGLGAYAGLSIDLIVDGVARHFEYLAKLHEAEDKKEKLKAMGQVSLGAFEMGTGFFGCLVSKDFFNKTLSFKEIK